MMHKAINNANDGITIFKDGKVFAKARKATEVDGVVGVKLLPEYTHLIPDMGSIPKKCVFLHYCAFTGCYLDAFVCFLDSDTAFVDTLTVEIDVVFDGTVAADTRDFRWGMVPDNFKSFDGYRSMEREYD